MSGTPTQIGTPHPTIERTLEFPTRIYQPFLVWADALFHEDLAQERFERQAQLAKTLIYPHIVPVIDSFADAEHLYLVMPYIHGRDLWQIYKADGVLRLARMMTDQLLTGTSPFVGGVGNLVYAHLNQPAPDIRLVRADIPPSVALVLMRAMAKDPDDRFATAGDFIRAMHA